MLENKINILSTRPLAQVLIEKAAAKNIAIDVFSFIETEWVMDDSLKKTMEELSGQALTIVFTSMNAVEVVAHYLGAKQPDWTIYCIGSATKILVKEKFGAGSLAGTADSASALAEIVIKGTNKGPVVFFCGDQRRDELPLRLLQHRIPLQELVVYKTLATSTPIQKQYDGILFFSPSAVRSFFAQNKIAPDAVLFSIGKSTAAEIKQFCQNKIIIAREPSKALLAEDAIQYFETHPIHH